MGPERPQYKRTNSAESTSSNRSREGRVTKTSGRSTPQSYAGSEARAHSTGGKYITWDLNEGNDSNISSYTASAGPVGDVLYSTFQLRPHKEVIDSLPRIKIPASIHNTHLRQPTPLRHAINQGWIPSPRALSPARPAVLELPTNQELMQIYLEITAPRLMDTSPLHIDLFRTELPAMAQKYPALMEAMLALAAVQIGLMRRDGRITMTHAPMHYEWALRGHFRGVADEKVIDTDVPLATSILLAFYELWNGELVKMGIHMLGGRNIILARGKEKHKTPVGRALLATFVRTDIGTSTITGNPCFMTNEWWSVDPYIQQTIDEESEQQYAADAALAKLCVIYNKLTHLKRWALDRRRKVWQKSKEQSIQETRQQKSKLESIIEKKAEKLEEDIEEWYDELPPWFRPQEGENESDEDINDSLCPEIRAKPYPSTAIALTLAMSYAAQLQIFRVAHPSQPVAPPHLGSLVHSILRIFEFTPTTADVSMLPWVFTAGIELRRPSHQNHLLTVLTNRVNATGLYAITFARDGLAYAYAKLAGEQSPGRFIKVKEGATESFPGISENMWNAEGVLGQLEALSLYDAEDLSEEKWTFKGDFETTGNDDEVPYEVDEAKDKEMEGEEYHR